MILFEVSMSLLSKTNSFSDRRKFLGKHMKEALNLDQSDRPIEAYLKYLSCMLSIVQTLQEDTLGGETWELNKDSRESYFQFLEHCLNRATSNVHLAYEQQAKFGFSTPQPSPSTPHEDSRSFPPPTSHRSYSNESTKKDCFITTVMKHHRSVCSSKSQPQSNDPQGGMDTRNHYIQQIHSILSVGNVKPETRMSINLELARRLQEDKELKRKQTKLLEEQQNRLKREASAQDNYHMTVHKVTLKQRVDNFSRRNRWIVSSQRHFRSCTHDTEKEKFAGEFASGILRLSGHPLCLVLNQYQMEVFQNVSGTYQKLHQAGDFPTLSLSCNLPNFSNFCSFNESNPEDASELTDSLSSSSSSLRFNSDYDLASCDAQEAFSGRLVHGDLRNLRKLKSEVTEDSLKKLCELVLSKMDYLEFSVLECYPDLKQFKYSCREAVEQVFLHALWVPLLSLFRCKNLDRELTLAKHMIERINDPPSSFKVPEHLCLWDNVANPNKIPYMASINKLRYLTEKYDLSEKVASLNESSHLIISSIDEYEQSQKEGEGRSSTVGTDDLLPIVCFTTLRSCTPQLLSECEMIGSLLPENALFGEVGFCLSTIQTALNYLISKQLEEPDET